MRKYSILVTGSSGFVGAHIAFDLASVGHDVVAVGGQRSIDSRVALRCKATRNGNLAESTFVSEQLCELKPDVIIHAAALADANQCEREPQRAEEANVVASQTIADCFPETPIIYISTDLVFDGAVAPESGFSEGDAVCPATVYGKTKADGEKIFLERGTLGMVARTCLVYGQPIGTSAGFLGWLTKALTTGEEVGLFIDEWRTPVFSRDVSHALGRIVDTLVQSGESLSSNIVHLAGAERMSRHEFGELYAELLGVAKSSVRSVRQSEFESLAKRPRDVSLSSEFLRKEFGVHPLGAREGLCKMLQASDAEKRE